MYIKKIRISLKKRVKDVRGSFGFCCWSRFLFEMKKTLETFGCKHSSDGVSKSLTESFKVPASRSSR